jgi:hypothetical protein
MEPVEPDKTREGPGFIGWAAIIAIIGVPICLAVYLLSGLGVPVLLALIVLILLFSKRGT